MTRVLGWVVMVCAWLGLALGALAVGAVVAGLAGR